MCKVEQCAVATIVRVIGYVRVELFDDTNWFQKKVKKWTEVGLKIIKLSSRFDNCVKLEVLRVCEFETELGYEWTVMLKKLALRLIYTDLL